MIKKERKWKRMIGKNVILIPALASLAALAHGVPTASGQDQIQAPQQSQVDENRAPAQTAASPTLSLPISLGREYWRPKPQLPNLFAPYSPIQVEQPQLSNSPRVEQLIRAGQLELSLQNAIELALENNINITVQRYYPWIADTDLLRTEGGAGSRGVGNTSTPGSFAAIPAASFDPAIISTVNVNSSRFPVNNPLIAGVGTAVGGPQSVFIHTTVADVQYTQAFHTGTAIALGFSSTRSSTTSPAQLFSPSVQTAATFSFSQQLLNGFGRLPNQRFIRIARLAKNSSDFGFVQSVMGNITQVQNLYWELVFARGDVEVRKRSVELAERLVNDNRMQVEIGTLAPIEIVRAEAQLASAQQALIAAETLQLQQQASLKSVITRNLLDPAVRDVEIVPTDSAKLPPLVEILPLADAVREALEKRPDLQQTRLNLCADDINVRATRNALLPTFTLSGFVSSLGLSGNTRGDSVTQSGFGDAVGTAFSGDFPQYQMQFSVNIPLRNRAAQADHARAMLVERQDQARLQQFENNVVVDVHNAQIALQQARAAVTAAQKTRELQEQTLAAEETKLQLGASTIFLVVQAQRDLSTAASGEVRALVDLVKARVDFERAMGRTLEVNRISVVDELGVVRCHTQNLGSNFAGQIIGQSP